MITIVRLTLVVAGARSRSLIVSVRDVDGMPVSRHIMRSGLLLRFSLFLSPFVLPPSVHCVIEIEGVRT